MMEVAPSFSRVLKDCAVFEGQDFVLQCSVQGTPVPQITWLLNGEPPVPVPDPSALPQSSGPFALPAFPLGFPFVTLNHTRIRRKHRLQKGDGTESLLLPAGDTGQVTAPV